MPVVIFVTLNIFDAYLTKAGLMAGAVEINPLMAVIGSSVITKGLIAVGLALALYFFRKERLLWPLNLALFGIVLWNSATWLIVTLLPLHSLTSVYAGS